MPEYFAQESEPGFAERYLGGWRVVASAWAIAIVAMLLFGGVQALASRHATPAQHEQLLGAVIPRHDPSCGGPSDMMTSATPNCRAISGDVLERAEADTEASASYGF